MTNLNRTQALRQGLEQIVRTQPETDTQLTLFTDLDVEHEPLPIRKAKALALLLKETPIHIYPGELIVGIPFREKPIYDGEKDAYFRGLPHESVSGKLYVENAQRKISSGVFDEAYNPVIFGSSPSTFGLAYALFPHYATKKERTEALRFGLDENGNPGHLQAGHARVVTLGWTGLRQMAEEKLAILNESTDIGKKRGIFLRSVITALEGAQTFAHRYADLAKKMAEKEVEPRRRQELIEISGICHRIAEAPPQTFWEALQIHWFTHLICNTQGARQLGRFDQYMYPFLENDLREGRLTIEAARELLDCLWIKYNMLTDVTMDNLQNMILGGLTREGHDATNMLSYLCMEATDRLGLIDPKWSVRVHKKTPESFLRMVCEIIKKGRYQPGIYNDEAIIKALVNIGIPLEDARDYTNDGCSEILVQGKSNPWCFEAKVNLPKCLERAIRNLEEYETFDDLWML